ncbi:MAG: alpha/beta hydrolase [Mucilaginibacter sp.]|nr:alpha/beta hydrolase [Mucilaginibacter sp.]
MPKIFLIAGLGADKRLFKNIQIPDRYEVVYVEWPEPKLTDTLANYSQSIINQYHIIDKDITIGVSLGGVISTEIAKRVNLGKVILISSIKTDSETPWYFNIFRKLPVYKLTSGKLFNKLGFVVRLVFGSMSKEDQALFKSMLSNSSPIFLKWAMGAILNWRNDVIPPNLYHIIGDSDLVFPYKNIKNPTAVIKGGTHIMIFDKAAEINAFLADILKT